MLLMCSLQIRMYETNGQRFPFERALFKAWLDTSDRIELGFKGIKYEIIDWKNLFCRLGWVKFWIEDAATTFHGNCQLCNILILWVLLNFGNYV